MRVAFVIARGLSDNFIMEARQNSSAKTSYDVAPAHDADSVQTAPPRETAMPQVSDAAVEEIKTDADEAIARRARELRVGAPVAAHANAPAANELRGEEFDFDFSAPTIEPEAAELPPKPKYGWAWMLLALALLVCVYTFGAANGEKSRRPLPIGPFTAPGAQKITVKVQVAGAVNKPGVYELPFNARVQDAIRKAGGLKPRADASALNLADWAQDGAKIEVPSKAQPAPTATPTVIIKEVPVAALPSANIGESLANSNVSAPKIEKSESGIPLAKTESGATSANASLDYLKANPVDLNTATQAQLEVLPGVGPKMAERIIAYRTENKRFRNVDELDEVKGIGEKRMATLKPLVKVR